MPLPLPVAPALMVIHEEPLVAVQAQPEGDVTLTLPVPPDEVYEALAGAIAYVHVIPAWVTEKVWPATVSVPVREVVPVFAATE